MYAAIIMFISLSRPHAQIMDNALVFKAKATCEAFMAGVIKDPSVLKDTIKVPPATEATIAGECVLLKPAAN
jgi:hypothetical protein